MECKYDEMDMKDEEVNDKKRDPNMPYSLGPKILDWDQQRAAAVVTNTIVKVVYMCHVIKRLLQGLDDH